MKNIFITLLLVTAFIAFSCEKEEEFTNLQNLTLNVWDADSLLANGADAGGTGQLLEKFNGEVTFAENGTGVFGEYEGTWYFIEEETKMVIDSDSLLIPLTMNIEELTSSSLKITTIFPNFSNPNNPTNIRMTFKAK